MKPLPAWLASIGIPNVGNLPLYERAMTHGSTGKPDYQRLEFLGDAVLSVTDNESWRRASRGRC